VQALPPLVQAHPPNLPCTDVIVPDPSGLPTHSSLSRLFVSISFHSTAWSRVHYVEEERGVLIDELSADGAGVDGEEREGRAAVLSAMARTSPELLLAAHAAPALNGLAKAAKDDRVPCRCAAARGLARLAVASAAQSGPACPYLPKLLPVLSRLLRDNGSEVREAAAGALKRLTKEHPEVRISTGGTSSKK